MKWRPNGLKVAIEIDVDIRCEASESDEQGFADLLERVSRQALTMEGWVDAEVSVVLTSDEEIRELNHQYRGIDSPTDVLSFPLLEGEHEGAVLNPSDFAHGDDPQGEPIALGDVVISLERAKSQAQEYGHALTRELAFLTVHGILHLLGYDHESEELERVMRAKEEAILNSLDLRRV